MDEWTRNNFIDVLEAVESGLPNRKIITEIMDEFVYCFNKGMFENVVFENEHFVLIPTPHLSTVGGEFLEKLTKERDA